MATLSTFWNIALVVVGLGFVIFFHELGHFLLAKWNGVKVEKFSIGFGPTLLGFQRGETEYVIAAIPLGGFVKMLGEGTEGEATRSTDPRAFPNKSVGARMAIISAGVIMNVILGLACFAYAYGHGMLEAPAKIGGVVAGSPAFEAGLRPGDDIAAIDGKTEISFANIILKVRLSGEGQTLRFDIKRPGRDEPIRMEMQPRREPGIDFPTVGILPTKSLDAFASLPPAGTTGPSKLPADLSDAERKAFETLVAAGPEGEAPTPLAEHGAYQRLLCKYPDRPLVHVFERHATPDAPASGKSEFTLPPSRFVDFGFTPTAEPISAIRKESIAERAGFRAGDRIVKVDGREDFDPMRLPTDCLRNAGKAMTFEVERGSGPDAKRVTLTATPDDSPAWLEPILPKEPLEVPGLGLAFPIRPKIQAVRPDSPAARAGLKPGDEVTAMGYAPKKPASAKDAAAKETGKKDSAPELVGFGGDDGAAWPSRFQELQYHEGPVLLVVNNGSSPVSVTPEPVDGWYFPDRGLRFVDLFRKLPPQSIGSAIRRGWDDTVENILSIYAMIRSLAQHRVGTKGVAGPVRIAGIAYQAASSGLTDLIHFLGLISINLAVINFLPIPPLDGGQMAFLIAEKVRGKPLPESALTPMVVTGLVLILCLFVFVTYQDIFSFFGK
ncbi:Regulator of sigma-E protease RseP [Aquisphaera giovannonii]|uniref:Regulator of sigma-E protease RseP n=1 Tax=Aquisphaera giovannonii TaxID=406548 RepID=A0A5B9WAN3_9BACT|nr:site-2 protease family protein [Aquisphaera giovannonii]QEH37309.1 Regulator of sigma-E protease RseP [Aquisphaera giovannonii]